MYLNKYGFEEEKKEMTEAEMMERVCSMEEVSSRGHVITYDDGKNVGILNENAETQDKPMETFTSLDTFKHTKFPLKEGHKVSQKQMNGNAMILADGEVLIIR